MTVTLSGDRIRISGAGRIEDAEALLSLLRLHSHCTLDLAEAEALHTSVVQVLLAFHPRMTGIPDDPFFRTWLLPALTASVADPVIVTMGALVAEAAMPDANKPDANKPGADKLDASMPLESK